MARASATRRAMPPESAEGINRAAPRSPTASSFIITRSPMSSSGRSVCSRIWKATLSNTDMSVNRAPNWNSMPIFLRRAKRPALSSESRFWPSTRVVPALALSQPAMIRSRVVLPQPDWPMMPTTRPGSMRRLTPCSTGRAAS